MQLKTVHVILIVEDRPFSLFLIFFTYLAVWQYAVEVFLS